MMNCCVVFCFYNVVCGCVVCGVCVVVCVWCVCCGCCVGDGCDGVCVWCGGDVCGDVLSVIVDVGVRFCGECECVEVIERCGCG